MVLISVFGRVHWLIKTTRVFQSVGCQLVVARLSMDQPGWLLPTIHRTSHFIVYRGPFIPSCECLPLPLSSSPPFTLGRFTPSFVLPSLSCSLHDLPCFYDTKISLTVTFKVSLSSSRSALRPVSLSPWVSTDDPWACLQVAPRQLPIMHALMGTNKGENIELQTPIDDDPYLTSYSCPWKVRMDDSKGAIVPPCFFFICADWLCLCFLLASTIAQRTNCNCGVTGPRCFSFFLSFSLFCSVV